MAATGLLYLDSSAIVKLIAAEPESGALAEGLRNGGPAIVSAIAKVEVHRALNRLGNPDSLGSRAAEVLDRIALIKIDDAILQQASEIGPSRLRSLDALHLATALSVRDHLEAFVVYDRRLAEAAEGLGLPVSTPS